MIYLDNAATSYPKPRSVITEVNRCIKQYCGNPGRSSHVLSVKSAEKIYEAREVIANHFNLSNPENVVFTPNATYALNLAIKTMIPNNCHVLCSDFEHNSVIRPLKKLEKTCGVVYSCFSSAEEIPRLIRPQTHVIVCSLASNVTGQTHDLDIISKICKQNNLILIVDASQIVGHQKINLALSSCDAFCAPGHKSLFGIQGSGFIIFKNGTRGESFIEGGSGTESSSYDMPMYLPEGYEAGTLSTPSIVSLAKGIKYIEEVGISNIKSYLDGLTDRLFEQLSENEGLNIYGMGCGILSFNLRDYKSTFIASELSKRGICVRGGLHCAPSIHKKLGTLDQGAVRVSFSYFNRKRDVDIFCKALKEIK